MGKKRWIKSYPIWIEGNKSVTAIQLVFSAFLYCHHFDCALFYVRISISFTHTHVEQWIFGFVDTKFEFYCFFLFIHFNFFAMGNLELLAFCFDPNKYVSIKRKRLTQTQMRFEHNKTFIVFVFCHLYFICLTHGPEKKTQTKDFVPISVWIAEVSDFSVRWPIYLLKFYTHPKKGLTHPPPPKIDERKKQIQ